MLSKNRDLIPKKVIICVFAICMLAFSLAFTVYAEENLATSNSYEAVVKGTVYDADSKTPISSPSMV